MFNKVIDQLLHLFSLLLNCSHCTNCDSLHEFNPCPPAQNKNTISPIDFPGTARSRTCQSHSPPNESKGLPPRRTPESTLPVCIRRYWPARRPLHTPHITLLIDTQPYQDAHVFLERLQEHPLSELPCSACLTKVPTQLLAFASVNVPPLVQFMPRESLQALLDF